MHLPPATPAPLQLFVFGCLIVLISDLYDEPDEVINEIMQDIKNIEKIIGSSVKEISAKGDDRHKTFVLSRLADIAIADGKLMKPESEIIFEIAKELGD